MKFGLYCLIIMLSTTTVLASQDTLRSQNISTQDTNTVSGFYEGHSEEGYYNFTLEDSTALVIEDVEFDLPVDLDDEVSIGKWYKLTWVFVDIEMADDFGQATGEAVRIKLLIDIFEEKQ